MDFLIICRNTPCIFCSYFSIFLLWTSLLNANFYTSHIHWGDGCPSQWHMVSTVAPPTLRNYSSWKHCSYKVYLALVVVFNWVPFYDCKLILNECATIQGIIALAGHRTVWWDVWEYYMHTKYTETLIWDRIDEVFHHYTRNWWQHNHREKRNSCVTVGKYYL